jgi:integrase
MGQKNPKGSVSVTSDNNRIRLRWRFQQQRYSFNFSSYSKMNLLEAKKVGIAIESDMQENHFDHTLKRYKLPCYKKANGLPSVDATTEVHDHSVSTKIVAPVLGTVTTDSFDLVVQFEFWVKNYRNMDCEKDVDYNATRNMMRRWGQFEVSSVLYNLNQEKFAAQTYNKRLTLLRAFFAWAEKNRMVIINPLTDVVRRKVKRTENDKRKPFTPEEVKRILEAFRTDSCCPKCSGYKHSHYYPFIYFIFKTGVRNGEAIGLRVKHLDFSNQRIQISEVLSRNINSTNAAARTRKETKNGKVRVLPLTPDLRKILLPLVKYKNADDLVFISPTGKCVDDRMFQKRIFSHVMKELNIEHRNLYACRHTFGTRCIQERLTPVMTAFLMGNNPETALRNYVHLTELPKQLPKIG